MKIIYENNDHDDRVKVRVPLLSLERKQHEQSYLSQRDDVAQF